MIPALLQRAKKRDWFLAALAAFVLTFLSCIHQNRELSLSDDSRFWQFAVVGFVSFASLGCVFILEHFWMAATLIAAGGACVFLYTPETRALYLYAALPAVLTVFFLRYVPWTEQTDRWKLPVGGVYLAAELAGLICLGWKLTASNALLLRDLLPITNLFGRLENNHYGLLALIVLFALFAVFGFRRGRKQVYEKAPEQTGNKKSRQKTRRQNLSGGSAVLWLRYAAVCLFFLFVILSFTLFYKELFLPVPSFVNLAAVFVVAAYMASDGTAQDHRQEAS